MDAEEKLANYMKEVIEDMRWRRDSEHRYFVFAAGIATASVAASVVVARWSGGPVVAAGAFLALALVVTLVCLSSAAKIYQEHKVYRALGGSVVASWKRLGFDLHHGGAEAPGVQLDLKVLPRGAFTLGKGLGYVWTLAVLAVTCASVVGYLIALAILWLAGAAELGDG